MLKMWHNTAVNKTARKRHSLIVARWWAACYLSVMRLTVSVAVSALIASGFAVVANNTTKAQTDPA